MFVSRLAINVYRRTIPRSSLHSQRNNINHLSTPSWSTDLLRRSRNLIKTQISNLSIRFKEKPYSTIFLVSVSCASLVPLGLFVAVMISLSSLYFLVYFLAFLFVGVVASVFIIPLLTVSFIFASCVVIFGFLSDITFKFAQLIYFKTDHRLKSTLNKMGQHTRKSETDLRPQVMKNYASARIRTGFQQGTGSTSGTGTTVLSSPFDGRTGVRVTS